MKEKTQNTREVSAEIVLALFVLVKTIAAHGVEHPLTLQMAETLAAQIEASKPPWSLQFIRSGVFRDMSLLELNGEAYRRARTLALAFNHLQIHELTIERVIDATTWLRFATALSRGLMGPSRALEGLQLQGLSWRQIAHAGEGDDQPDMDPEVYAISQIALTMGALERWLEPARSPWSWRDALGQLRYIERASQAHPQATMRALELAPVGWDEKRRAVSVAAQTMLVLQQLGAPQQQVRACAHVGLGLGMMGFRARAGQPFDEAAPALYALLTQSLASAEALQTPTHYLQTAALAGQLLKPPTSWRPELHLLQLLYQLELERSPLETHLHLAITDLLSIAARDMGTRYPPVWVRALVQTHGKWPPGAHVRCPDGSLGVILGVEGQRVQVMAQGKIEGHPLSAPLQLLSTWELEALW